MVATARWLGEDALARYFDVPAIARFVKGVRLYKYGRAGYVFQQLAKLLTLEQGKPLAEARGEEHVGARRD